MQEKISHIWVKLKRFQITCFFFFNLQEDPKGPRQLDSRGISVSIYPFPEVISHLNFVLTYEESQSRFILFQRSSLISILHLTYEESQSRFILLQRSSQFCIENSQRWYLLRRTLRGVFVMLMLFFSPLRVFRFIAFRRHPSPFRGLSPGFYTHFILSAQPIAE